jgi:hypothetical protein
MTPTIRDYLKRRTRTLQATALCGWLICAGGVFLMSPSTSCRPRCGSSAPPLPVLLGFPLFGGAIVWMMFFTKCPRCSGRLGHLLTTTGGFFSKPVNFCPYCGVSLDEPFEKPQGS